MMRISFSNMTTARAAVHVLEAYGYSAERSGRDVVTDCPTLLAVPAIEKRVGLAEIERLDCSGRADSIGLADELSPGLPGAPRADLGRALTA
jgi:hypothetical protein